jgi:L-lysine exporter family protein LysE/ArgO
MDLIILTILAVFITIIGALPLGLVNLSVLDTSYREGTAPAMNLSHGAAVIEIAFGLAALTAGGLIAQFIGSNRIFHYLVPAVPAAAGIFFLMKKGHKQSADTGSKPCFFRGMVLNLISIQVLLYWLFATTYLHAVLEIDYTVFSILFFALGIWLGKMGVLWLYAAFSNKILGRIGFVSRNINRIIGVVLLLAAVVQLVKG